MPKYRIEFRETVLSEVEVEDDELTVEQAQSMLDMGLIEDESIVVMDIEQCEVLKVEEIDADEEALSGLPPF